MVWSVRGGYGGYAFIFSAILKYSHLGCFLNANLSLGMKGERRLWCNFRAA